MKEVVIALRSNVDKLEKEFQKAGELFSGLLNRVSQKLEVAVSTTQAEKNIRKTANVFDNLAGRVIALNQSLEVAKALIMGFSGDVKAAAGLGVLREQFKGTAEDIELFKQATAGTVKEATLLELSNQATDLGVSLQDQAILFNIAEDAADKYGGATDDNFRSLVFTTEGATKALKSLGIQKDVYEQKLKDLATAEGKTIEELDGEAEKRLRVKAILQLSGQTLDDVKNKQRDNADTLDAMGTSFEAAKVKIAEGFLPAVKIVGEIVIWLNERIQSFTATTRVLIGVLGFATTAFLLMGDTLNAKFYAITLLIGAVITLITAFKNGEPVIVLISSLLISIGVAITILRTSFLAMAHGWVFNLGKMANALFVARMELKFASIEGRTFAGVMTAAGISVKGFFASLGPIGLAMLGISALASLFAAFGNEVDEVKEKTESYEEALERKAGKDNIEVVNLQAQQVGYNLLVGELIKTNAASAERAKLVKEIQSKYPDLIKNIDLNSAGEKELGIWKEWVNRQFETRIKLMILEKKAALIAEDIAKAELDILSKTSTKTTSSTGAMTAHQQQPTQADLYANFMANGPVVAGLRKDVEEKRKLLLDLNKQADQLRKTIGGGGSSQPAVKTGSGKSGTATKKYEEDIAKLEEEKRRNEINNISADNAIKQQLEIDHQRKKKEIVEQALKSEKLTNDEKNRLELQSLDLQKQILESEIKIKQEALDEKFKLDTDALKRKQELESADLDASEAKKGAEIELEREHLQEKLDIYKSYGKDVTEIEHQLALNSLKLKKHNLEKEKEDLKASEGFKKTMLDARVVTESEQFDQDRRKNSAWLAEQLANERLTGEQKVQLYEVYEAKNSEISSRENEYRLGKTQEILSNLGGLFAQHTAAYKAFAIASAIITTYEAATKALLAGPIIGPILMGSIIAAGMAQVANIIATEVPGYAKGGAVVGENGPEIITPMQDYASGQVLLATETANAVQRAIMTNGSSNTNNQDLIRELREWPKKVRFDLGLDAFRGGMERIRYQDGLAI